MRTRTIDNRRPLRPQCVALAIGTRIVGTDDGSGGYGTVTGRIVAREWFYEDLRAYVIDAEPDLLHHRTRVCRVAPDGVRAVL